MPRFLEYLFFRRWASPVCYQMLFWLALAFITVDVLGILFDQASVFLGTDHNPVGMTLFWLGIIFLLRVIIEFSIVPFRKFSFVQKAAKSLLGLQHSDQLLEAIDVMQSKRLQVPRKTVFLSWCAMELWWLPLFVQVTFIAVIVCLTLLLGYILYTNVSGGVDPGWLIHEIEQFFLPNVLLDTTQLAQGAPMAADVSTSASGIFPMMLPEQKQGLHDFFVQPTMWRPMTLCLLWVYQIVHVRLYMEAILVTLRQLQLYELMRDHLQRQ
jgi:hypothetical protein